MSLFSKLFPKTLGESSKLDSTLSLGNNSTVDITQVNEVKEDLRKAISSYIFNEKRFLEVKHFSNLLQLIFASNKAFPSTHDILNKVEKLIELINENEIQLDAEQNNKDLKKILLLSILESDESKTEFIDLILLRLNFLLDDKLATTEVLQHCVDYLTEEMDVGWYIKSNKILAELLSSDSLKLLKNNTYTERVGDKQYFEDVDLDMIESYLSSAITLAMQSICKDTMFNVEIKYFNYPKPAVPEVESKESGYYMVISKMHLVHVL